VAAWLGMQLEAIHVSQTDFYVATILVSTVTLLLTLILVV
jgi:hypothetical protein